MQNNRMVYVALGLVILALVAGVTVRYEVLKGRNMVESKLITDFNSCLEAQGDLDVTGTVCTSAAGNAFTKPGTVSVNTTPTETPTTSVGTTTSTTTASHTAPLTLGVETTFLPHDTKSFTGGTTITLNSISDSRCKPGVQCIWAGEFSTDWTITNGTSTKTISLGTVRTSTTTESGYTYSLGDVNEDHAVLTVAKVKVLQ